MKSEKVLEALNDIIKQIEVDNPEYNFKKYYDLDMNSVSSLHNGAPSMMADLCKTLQMDILKSGNKGKANRTKAALRILKNAQKEQFTKAFIDDDGREIVLDGYRAICFANPVDGLPVADNDDKGGFKSIKDNCFNGDYNKPLCLASLDELKAELKIDKANNNGFDTGAKKRLPIYAFGVSSENYNASTPIVNLQYLIDIVEAMPTAKAYYKEYRYGIFTTFFKDEEGNMAILLPISIKDNIEGVKNILRKKPVIE